jgi:glycosyltransferase involved in cell wall biosynthesis
MANTEPEPGLSVVVPFFNEAEVALEVADELGRAMAELGLRWEGLLVDDGSTDGTLGELERARGRWPQFRLIRLSQNRGQGAALLRGILEARAPVIAMMDGDGQNVPADIGRMLPLLDSAGLVVGVRTPRHDSWLRRRMSRLANAVRRRLLHDGVNDAGCALKAFRREVVASFLPVQMLNPFMPAFAVSGGFTVAEIPVRHRPRRGGRSKYGLRRLLWRPCLDLLALSWILRRRIAPEAAGRPPGKGGGAPG